MKKICLVLGLVLITANVTGCTKCEVEPLVEENHKLIVPKNFGQMPK